MKPSLIILLAVFLVACTEPIPPATPTPTISPASSEFIEFESLTFPGHLWTPFMPPAEEGTATTISGILTIPASSGPIPAVIITHGCGGISTGEMTWVTRLNEFGVAAFMVHSFGARHIPGVCAGEGQINIASVLADAYAALDVLAANPRIDPERIAILGLSFGGRTALWVSHKRFQEMYSSGNNHFAAYLAFYPASCYLHLADETEVSGEPMRIFHGTADDWTPIGQCKAYVERLQQADVDIDLYEYPDAHHGFDFPQLPLHNQPSALSPGNCTFVEQDGLIIDTETGREPGIDSACVTRGVTSGYNAAAEQQAVVDVRDFLAATFAIDQSE
jgi:dienelactone hydrolase